MAPPNRQPPPAGGKTPDDRRKAGHDDPRPSKLFVFGTANECCAARQRERRQSRPFPSESEYVPNLRLHAARPFPVELQPTSESGAALAASVKVSATATLSPAPP